MFEVKIAGNPATPGLMVYPVGIGEDGKPNQPVLYKAYQSAGWMENLPPGGECSYHDIAVQFNPDSPIVKRVKPHEEGMVTIVDFAKESIPIK